MDYELKKKYYLPYILCFALEVVTIVELLKFIKSSYIPVTIQNACFSGRKNDLNKALIADNGCSIDKINS
jgi:hypothetical protein